MYVFCLHELTFKVLPFYPSTRRSYFSPYSCLLITIKGIFSDSNNIFSWHESEDMTNNNNNNKGLFPKFQSIPILCLPFTHDCVVFHCSIEGKWRRKEGKSKKGRWKIENARRKSYKMRRGFFFFFLFCFVLFFLFFVCLFFFFCFLEFFCFHFSN